MSTQSNHKFTWRQYNSFNESKYIKITTYSIMNNGDYIGSVTQQQTSYDDCEDVTVTLTASRNGSALPNMINGRKGCKAVEEYNTFQEAMESLL